MKPAGSPKSAMHTVGSDIQLKIQFSGRMTYQQRDMAGGKILRGFFLILKFFVFLAKSFNAACCINQFLFPGKKWMAFGTDFHTDVGLG
jgi:hypothetical protein